MSEELNKEEIDSLKRENEQLKKQLKLADMERKAFRKEHKFVALVSTLTILGPSLSLALNNWLKAKKDFQKPFPEPETAEVLAAVIRRILRIGIFVIIATMVPIGLMVWQIVILKDQNVIITTQNELIRVQNKNLIRAIDNQQEAYDKQKVAIDNQDKQFDREFERLKEARKTELLNYLYKTEGEGNDLKPLYINRIRTAALKEYVSNYDKELTKAILTGVNLESIQLESANLDNAKFEKANLSHANLKSASLRKVNLNASTLEGIILENADLDKANLESCNLEWAMFTEANLNEANLKKAHMKEVNLEKASLFHAELDGVKLIESDLSNANLEGASLNGADLSRAILRNVNLKKSNLQGATLEETILENAQYDRATKWPDETWTEDKLQELGAINTEKMRFDKALNRWVPKDNN